jgi:hypothetical protein
MSVQPRYIVELDVEGIDFDKLGEGMEEAINEGMHRLSEEVEFTWRRKAADKLNTSRQKYLEGLKVDLVGNEVQASLSGWFSVAIETGWERYDMKPGILKQDASKVIPIGKNAGETPKLRTMRAGSAGWWHPGFEPQNISDEVQKEMDDRVVEEVFGPLLGRVSI